MSDDYLNFRDLLKRAIHGTPGNAGLAPYFGTTQLDYYENPYDLMQQTGTQTGGDFQPLVDALIQAMTQPDRAMSAADICRMVASGIKDPGNPDREELTKKSISEQFTITYDYEGVASRSDLKKSGGINIYGDPTLNQGTISAATKGKLSGITDMLPVNGREYGVNKNPASPATTRPALAVIQIYDSKKTITSRNTGGAQIFFNSIPPVELSRCVPYFNLSMITGDQPIGTDKRLSGVSLSKAIMGSVSVDEWKGYSDMPYDSVLATVVTGRDIRALQLFGIDTSDISASGVPGTVGMEIFTSPQTLAPVGSGGGIARYHDGAAINTSTGGGSDALKAGGGDANRQVSVLDPFRPLASIESFSVAVEGQFAFQHFKKAKMELKVYDRSRLHELAPLIRPQYLGKVKLLIEYGWSHPNGSAASGNPIGQFLNSTRARDIFIVSNVQMSMDQGGEVKLSVQLHTSGAPDMDGTHVSVGEESSAEFKLIGEIIEALKIVRRRKQPKNAKSTALNSPDFFKSLRTTSAAMQLDKETINEIRAYIASVRDTPNASKDETTSATLCEQLLDGKGNTNEHKGLESLRKTTIADELAEKIKAVQFTPDPFLATSDALDAGMTKGYINPPIDPAAPRKEGDKNIKREYISLGKLITTFIGQPICSNGEISELQFIFYCFNVKAGFVRNLNMAQFPIHIDTFKQWYAKQIIRSGGDMSLSIFLMFVKKYFVSQQASHAYGLSNIYSLDQDGYEVREEFSKGSKLQTEITKRMLAAYGSAKEGEAEVPLETTDFTLPKMAYLIETVPRSVILSDGQLGAKTPSNMNVSIMRVHIFDRAHSTNVAPAMLAKAVLDNTIGVVADWQGRTRGKGIDPGHMQDHARWMDLAKKARVIEPLKSTAQAGPGGGGPTKYKLACGLQALKNFISLGVPTIKIGTNSSIITGLAVSTQNNPLLANIAIQRAHRSGVGAPPGYAEGGLPLQILPQKLQLTCIGNPLLEYGQEYFIDLQTGTSADNFYRCMRINHVMGPGKFESSLDMTIQDGFGRFEPAIDVAQGALQIIRDIEGGEAGGGASVAGIVGKLKGMI